MKTPATVVLIEDNLSDCEVVRRSLERSPVDVNLVVARCGEEAYRLLTPAPDVTLPGLVFLDLNLPDCDGREILRRVRSFPGSLHIPLVVLTTSDAPQDISECYRLGCNGYLVKPSSFADYLHVMSATVHYWLEVATRL